MVLCVLDEHCGKADLGASGLLFYDKWGCDSGRFLSVLDEGGTAKVKESDDIRVLHNLGMAWPWDLVILCGVAKIVVRVT